MQLIREQGLKYQPQQGDGVDHAGEPILPRVGREHWHDHPKKHSRDEHYHSARNSLANPLKRAREKRQAARRCPERQHDEPKANGRDESELTLGSSHSDQKPGHTRCKKRCDGLSDILHKEDGNAGHQSGDQN